MTETKKNIEVIPGETHPNILIIAPHGVNGDDDNTGKLALAIQKRLGCNAIINEAFQKPEKDKNGNYGEANTNEYLADLNYIPHAQAYPDFIDRIKASIADPDNTYVFWIHGIDDENVPGEAKKLKSPNLKCLVGYGQGKGNGNSMDEKKVKNFIKFLNDNNLSTKATHAQSKNYRGASATNMNQYFKIPGSDLVGVQSIQLEFADKEVREDGHIDETAEKVANAISATLEIKPVVMEEAVLETQPVEPTASDKNATEITVPTEVPVVVQVIEPEIVLDDEDPLVEPTASDKNATEGTVPTDVPVPVQVIEPEIVLDDEDPLVANAFEYLKNSFRQHFHEAMLEAGHYLVEKFYDKDYDWARQGKKPKKKESLNKLIERLQANSGDAPSKTWIYDALKLAVDDHFYNVEGGTLFRAFGKLGHTQKLRIAYVKQPEIKEMLIEEIAKHEEPFTDINLRKRIAEEKEKILKKKSHAQIKKEIPDENTGIDLTSSPPMEKLLQHSPDDLRRLFTLAKKNVAESQKAVHIYWNALHDNDIVLAETNGKDVLGKGGFWEWAKNRINICTGCKNDCIYCYMKVINAGNPKLKQPADWHNWEIRPKDVDKTYGLKDGWVGFPSSHDIFPDILEDYLTVLGKLLRAGNRVLIVSKPRLDCIRQICDTCHFFKDEILFRFTIGALDDEILKFWEPNAPGYKERRACLEFAYNQGFRTSVSMEPMLDTPRIERQIADLRQFVTVDIWLGIMSYLGYIKKGADDDLTAAIAKVKAGQTAEILTPIYKKYKDDPLIKWKKEALEIIEAHIQQNGVAAK